MGRSETLWRPADCLDAFANDLCTRVLRNCAPAQSYPSSPPVDAATAALERLLEAFQVRHDGRTFVDAAAAALQQLGEIPKILRWDEGLRDALHDLILATINEAERFGNGTGELKRRFAVDIITRVLRPYDESGLMEPVEDVVVAPFVGIEIDWMVQVLNIHNAWKPPTHVALPRFFDGRHGRLLRLNATLWRLLKSLSQFLLSPSRYERQLTDARLRIDGQVSRLYEALPPATWHRTAELLVNVVAKFGNLTAPHVKTIDALWRLSAELERLSSAGRREVVFRAALIVLRRAYAHDDLALTLLDSSIGHLLIRHLVFSTEWVLRKNSLLPGPIA
jgi:hypothetical protein